MDVVAVVAVVSVAAVVIVAVVAVVIVAVVAVAIWGSGTGQQRTRAGPRTIKPPAWFLFEPFCLKCCQNLLPSPNWWLSEVECAADLPLNSSPHIWSYFI